jgi:hypothetical protein
MVVVSIDESHVRADGFASRKWRFAPPRQSLEATGSRARGPTILVPLLSSYRSRPRRFAPGKRFEAEIEEGTVKFKRAESSLVIKLNSVSSYTRLSTAKRNAFLKSSRHELVARTR